MKLPAKAGLGLKPEHFRDLLASRSDVGFLEIHAENYMVEGGPYHAWLERLCAQFSLSVHGVGLSIGGETAPDMNHLTRLKKLLDRYEPALFSEHLAWSGHNGVFLNDLLPLPYTSETLPLMCSLPMPVSVSPSSYARSYSARDVVCCWTLIMCM